MIHLQIIWEIKMKIPKSTAVLFDIDTPPGDRRKLAEEALAKLSSTTPDYQDPDYTTEEYNGLFKLSVFVIMWLVIIGTSCLGMAGVYYLSVPSPTVHSTTQHGAIHHIDIISVKNKGQ
jgi:hypothetical protein